MHAVRKIEAQLEKVLTRHARAGKHVSSEKNLPVPLVWRGDYAPRFLVRPHEYGVVRPERVAGRRHVRPIPRRTHFRRGELA